MSGKKWTLVVAALSATTALCGGALAADLAADNVHDWSGLYIGAHGGYGEANVSGKFTGDPGDVFLLDGGGTFDLDLDGFVGGVHAGHNWQTGNFVLGLEGDATFVDWSDRLGPNGDDEVVSAKTNFVGSLRARTGYAMDNLLVFATAGAAITDTKYTAIDGSGDAGSLKFSDIGFVVGGGAEYALDQRWSIKAEALYFIFNDKKDAANLTNDSEVGDFAKLEDAFMVRVGVDFHF